MKTLQTTVLAVIAFVLTMGPGKNAAAEEPSPLGPLASLVGTWQGSHDMDKDGQADPVTITYRISGGGSALVETMSPGSDHEMVTIYSRDGDDYVLTHYCMLGNQPRMRARNDAEGKKFTFDFVDATGLKSPNDAHMHSLIVELPDADHLRETWSFYDKGAKQSDEVFELTRQP